MFWLTIIPHLIITKNTTWVHASRILHEKCYLYLQFVCYILKYTNHIAPKLYALQTALEPIDIHYMITKHICQKIFFSVPLNKEIDIYITEIYLIVQVWNNMRLKILDNFHFWLRVSEIWGNVVNKDAQYFVTVF